MEIKKSRGHQAQIEYEKKKAVGHARILLALQLKGPQFSSSLSEILALSPSFVAFSLHELDLAGEVFVSGRSARNTAHNRVNLWQATHDSNYLPPTVSSPQKRTVRVDRKQEMGITEEDLAYHQYWGLPKSEREKLPPPSLSWLGTECPQ